MEVPRRLCSHRQFLLHLGDSKVRFRISDVIRNLQQGRRENLEFYSRMFDVSNARERINEVVGTMGMKSRLNDRTGTLSRGMQQRISIARSLIHDPDIMLLDEPETGLDQEAMPVLWQVLKNEDRKKRTIIMATHNLERGLELGNHFIILSRGKIVHENTGQKIDIEALRKIYEETTRK